MTLFKNIIDPLELKNYIYKYVRIHSNNTDYTGVIYTIDPISQSIILVGMKEDLSDIYLITKENIQNLVVEGELLDKAKCILDLKFEPKTKKYLDQEIKDRRTQVEAFLTSRMIEVSYSGLNKETFSLFGGILLIEPPYEVENCQSSNGMVLKQMQRLMKQLVLV